MDISLDDVEGDVMAGISGGTFGRALYIDLLWVDERLRGHPGRAEHMAEVFIKARPGLPSTADIDEALEESGMVALRDGKLAIDIRRGYDLYASLLS